MTTRLLTCLLCLALAACAVKPVAAPPPVLAAPKPVAPPDEVGPILVYQQSLRGLGAPELAKELASQDGQAKNARQSLRMALVLMQSRSNADLARAQGLIDGVTGAADEPSLRLKPLAQLLAAYCADLRRSGEHADKLGQQLKDSQRRTEQLNDKLESLKAIERNLPTRPGQTGNAGASK